MQKICRTSNIKKRPAPFQIDVLPPWTMRKTGGTSMAMGIPQQNAPSCRTLSFSRKMTEGGWGRFVIFGSVEECVKHVGKSSNIA